MTSRQTREQAGGVLSFTFLDVLTCTMGSLVLLVVVLGQKAASTRLEDALRYGPRKGDAPSASVTAAETVAAITSPESSTSASGPNSAVVSQELAELDKHQARLAELRAKAVERLAEEKARVSHLEEHERRLEHELAQLHITLERLADAEKEQSIDQETAERELARLKQLVADTETQLQSLRESSAGKKSYAIIPYQGENGTFRRPIYIECTADAAIIQPEGIKLTKWDLDGPIRSGNPLASAVRAASEELNARARAAGSKPEDLPDPYPLILVRPDGALTYSAVIRAVENWDVQYGYELIEADWDIEFPETDPRLAQVMIHAIEQARSRQAMLARAAPKTYGSVGMMVPATRDGGGAAGGRIAGGGAAGGGSGLSVAGDPGGRAGTSVGGTAANSFYGSPPGGSGAYADSGQGQGDMNFGQLSQGGGADDQRDFADIISDQSAGQGSAGQATVGGQSGATALASGGSTATGNGGSPPGNASPQGGASPPGAAPPNADASAGGAAPSTGLAPSSTALSAPPAPDVHRSQQSPEMAGRTGGVAPTVQANANTSETVVQAQDRPATESAATTRGSNWANLAASQRATPMTRPIRVVVRTDQIQVIGESDGAFSGETKAVSFHQPTDQVLDELAAAVQEHIAGWGLAGQSLYWRPTLVLQVAPGANQHAIRLNDLLRDSGVDVRFQEVASAPSQETTRATR